MIRRPLDQRFGEAVRTGRKTTTIRRAPWPAGVPIMLYHWADAAYRSPQRDAAVIIVTDTTPITIGHQPDGLMTYTGPEGLISAPLWQSEGFASRAEMDAWFRPLVDPGACIPRHLMTFALRGREA